MYDPEIEIDLLEECAIDHSDVTAVLQEIQIRCQKCDDFINLSF